MPIMFDWTTFLFREVCCWCQPRWYKDYNKGLAAANKDFTANMNIVTVLRRMRMHGFALTSMLDFQQ